MAELLDQLRKLRAVGSATHWFCPRRTDDDTDTYDEKDLDTVKVEDDGSPTAERRRIVAEAKGRTQLAFNCLQILMYDEEEALQYQKEVRTGLDEQLSRCDLCIRWYYRGKRVFLEKMRQDYNEEEVASFTKTWDENDISRIKRGLVAAAAALRAMDPGQRALTRLGAVEMFAIFECLSCEAFLRDANLLTEYFDEPFQLAQSTKRLRVRQYLPAMTWLLFDPKPERSSWAMQSWSAKHRNPLTKEDFEWTVREPLHRALVEVSSTADPDFLARFWCGMKLIVEKSDKELVTHCLRALDIDICRLALEHVHFDTPGFRFLLHTIEDLFRKAPNDFWDAMGAISPVTVVEQIFNNPQCVRFIVESKEDETYELSALKDMLSWIEPFMRSLKTANQPPACRALVFQLLDRLQSNRFPEFSKRKCYRQGLATLALTLQNFVGQSAAGSVARIVVADTLEVVTTHVKGMLDITLQDPASEPYQELSGLCMDVVRNALSLDCKSLKADHESLEAGRNVQHDVGAFSPQIWEAVIGALQPGNVLLAQNVLRGIGDIVGLEKIRTKSDHQVAEKNRYNTSYGRISQLFCDILERLAEFDPNDLDRVFQLTETANTLFAALFSSDEGTYQAAVDLIKAVSAQFGRREAISHLLQSFFETSLLSLSWAIRRIAHKRTFASTPRMLKTCGDVVEVLCNPQDGMLRTRLLSETEVKAVRAFWTYLWQALTVIFEMTETWSTRNADKETMMEFCRDTMQFSERLFDQYSIFATAIDSAAAKVKSESDSSALEMAGVKKDLLRNPTLAVDAMVKWLRLRDVYLASTSVSLVGKILHRLTDLGMSVGKAPLLYIENVAVRQSVKTILTPPQKAELIRALEEHAGRTIPIPSEPSDAASQLKKQTSITSWTKLTDYETAARQAAATQTKAGRIDLDAWRAKAKKPHEVVEIPDDEDEFGDSGILDKDILALSRSVELHKQQKEAQRAQSRALPLKQLKSGPKIEAVDGKAFREKREKEREAKRLRDLQELARLKKNIPSIGAAEPTAQEGSALHGIGIKGKAHAPQGSSMMVSSESESESEEELDRTLFGIDKPAKVSKTMLEYRESKMRSLKEAKPQGPMKKTKQIRSARDMRARLAPDLTALHRTLLSWNFFHEGQVPPGSEKDDYTLVTNTFKTPNEYQNTFGPLLVLEAWQGFLKAKEEGNFKPVEISVVSRSNVDSFLEISATMSVADGRDNAIGEADIVVMSKSASPASDNAQPHCMARAMKVSRKKTVTEIIFRANPGNPAAASLTPGSTLHLVKVLSITPLEREHGALQGLQYYDLCEEVLRAKPSPLLDYSDKQLEPIIHNYNVNRAQAKAVRSAVDNDAFTLIQGPPGSGKTKTIVAIVGALLTNTLGDKGVSIARPLHAGRLNGPVARTVTSKKLLICAPSNAAVDELVMRLKQGVKTLTGEMEKLSVVRLGRSDAINNNVLDVTLDELVSQKLNLVKGDRENTGEEIQKLLAEHKKTSEEIANTRDQLNEARSKGEVVSKLEHVFDILKKNKTQLGLQLDAARDSGNTAARDAEISRRMAQQDIVDNANVICATLSGSGHEIFQSLSIEFETVIIDEAAQSIELSALIPLKYGCSKCILVGDPKQLPPTVLSREAARFQYEQSLFVRMQANHPNDVHLLDTQYRMHPLISRFPSATFYDGKLLDGPGMAELRSKPWHKSTLLGPYRFFDVQGQHQSAPRGHSLINLAEVEVALKLFQRLTVDYPTYDFKGKIGIITPYKSQLKEMKSKFASRFGENIFDMIEFNTTDAFQGRESEVIIFSCVRASSSRGIGFLADIRRMNVGLTRAKSSLWVLGNSQSLIQGEFWSSLIKDAKDRGVHTTGDLLKLLAKSTGGQSNKLGDFVPPRPMQKGSPDGDVEMPDAPPRGFDSVMRSHNGHSEAPVPVPSGLALAQNSHEASAQAEKAYGSKSSVLQGKQPSGGHSGLDARKTCAVCGSYAHLTQACDNDAAKIAGGYVCNRCGAVDHDTERCNQKRCMECGEFGHERRGCTSHKILSKAEKRKVQHAESIHKNRVQRLPEKQKKFQLGGHDPKVPVVQVARPTGAVGEGTARRGHGLERSYPPNTGMAKSDKADGRLEGIDGQARRNEQQLNGAATTSGKGPTTAEKGSGSRAPEHLDQASSIPRQGGAGTNAMPRAPPPPRRKREADPFIRPKPKKPRH